MKQAKRSMAPISLKPCDVRPVTVLSMTVSDGCHPITSYCHRQTGYRSIAMCEIQERETTRGKMFYVPPQVAIDKKLLKNVKNVLGGQVTNQVPSTCQCVIGTNPEMRHVISKRRHFNLCGVWQSYFLHLLSFKSLQQFYPVLRMGSSSVLEACRNNKSLCAAFSASKSI